MLVGIDVLDVMRMEKFVQNEQFLDKYFTSYEAMYVSQTNRKTLTLAGIYAAKEAFLKALGIGIFGGIALNEIEVNHYENGKPYIKLSENAKLIVTSAGIKDIQMNISHTDEIAIAVCVLN